MGKMVMITPTTRKFLLQILCMALVIISVQGSYGSAAGRNAGAQDITSESTGTSNTSTGNGGFLKKAAIVGATIAYFPLSLLPLALWSTDKKNKENKNRRLATAEESVAHRRLPSNPGKKEESTGNGEILKTAAIVGATIAYFPLSLVPWFWPT